MDGPLRNLTHLASDLWHYLVQKTLHHGLVKNWFTVTKHPDEACWLKKYYITSIGRHEKENGVKELTRIYDKGVKCKEEVIRKDHNDCPIDYSGRSKALSTPELLYYIFSYLEYQNLKSCRDVSHLWRGVVLRYYFNDNRGNSPRVLASAVSENSTTLRMKTLRFDIGLEGKLGTELPPLLTISTHRLHYMWIRGSQNINKFERHLWIFPYADPLELCHHMLLNFASLHRSSGFCQNAQDCLVDHISEMDVVNLNDLFFTHYIDMFISRLLNFWRLILPLVTLLSTWLSLARHVFNCFCYFLLILVMNNHQCLFKLFY